MDAREQLKDLLLQERTREKLIGCHRARGSGVADQPAVAHGLEEVRATFEARIIAKLPFPPPILLEELLELFQRYFLSFDDPCEQCYELFVREAGDRIIENFLPAPVACVGGHVVDLLCALHAVSDDDQLRPFVPFYEFENGALYWTSDGIVPANIRQSWFIAKPAYVQYDGQATESAATQFLRDLAPMISSILISIDMLQGNNPEMLGDMLPGIALSDPVDFKWTALFRRCLEVYFMPQATKESMKSRLRNALQLLSIADRQSHDGAYLALCCAAMEALVCSGGDQVTRQFSERIAMLLEDNAQRRPDAIKFLTKVYNARSEIVHGKELDTAVKTRRYARYLAAELLRAIGERIENYDESPESFFNELQALLVKAAPIPGVKPAATPPWPTGKLKDELD